MPQGHAPGREPLEAFQFECIEALSKSCLDTEDSDCDLCTTSGAPLTPIATWGPARTARDSLEDDCDYAQHLRTLEATNQVDAQYMRRQRPAPGGPPLTPHGRASAVDWMVDAAWQLGLSNDALFLAVALLDRYLAAGTARQAAAQQQRCGAAAAAPLPPWGGCGNSGACYATQRDLPQQRDQWRRPADGMVGGGGCCGGSYSYSCGGGGWQGEVPSWTVPQLTLMSAVCLWVAAKYEHSNAPPLELFSRCLLRGCFSTADILETEARLLTAIDYRIASVTTAKTFLRRLMFDLGAAEAARGRCVDERLYFLTSYLAEASLLEYGLLAFLPSRVAATAFALAHTLLGRALPSEALSALTGYGPAELAEPMRWLHHVHAALAQAGGLYAVTVKYRSPDMAHAAEVPPILSPIDPRIAACAAGAAAAAATGAGAAVAGNGAIGGGDAAAAAAAAAVGTRHGAAAASSGCAPPQVLASMAAVAVA